MRTLESQRNALLLLLTVLSALVLATARKEPDAGTQVTTIFTDETNAQFKDGGRGQWIREAHCKQHGCVRGLMTPLPNLPKNLAQGIFANPQLSYPLFVRYSNGYGRGFVPFNDPMDSNRSDTSSDIRGMALKLFNVTSGLPFLTPNVDTQCFTFTTVDRGFLDTNQSAIDFFTAVKRGKVALGAWMTANPRLASLLVATARSGNIASLLGATWYQAVPQMHGQYIAKYLIYPCNSSRQVSPLDRAQAEAAASKGFNFLRQGLQQDLAQGSECLRWAVQFYEDEESTPVNDSTVEWTTPFYDIATVDLFQQQFGTDQQETLCGAMSFNPWSTIAAHEPVGNLQQIRRPVYSAMLPLRRQLNNEPVGDVTYDDWLQYPDMQ